MITNDPTASAGISADDPPVRPIHVRIPIEHFSALTVALAPLAMIANEYDTNNLDEERPQWRNGPLALESHVETPFSEIELFSGRGGKRLLTLQDAFNARDALNGKQFRDGLVVFAEPPLNAAKDIKEDRVVFTSAHFTASAEGVPKDLARCRECGGKGTEDGCDRCGRWKRWPFAGSRGPLEEADLTVDMSALARDLRALQGFGIEAQRTIENAARQLDAWAVLKTFPGPGQIIINNADPKDDGKGLLPDAYPIKCWPFAESPGDIALQLHTLIDARSLSFPATLAAVRQVFIENPPVLARWITTGNGSDADTRLFSIENAIRFAFPHFQGEEPITTEAILAIGRSDLSRAFEHIRTLPVTDERTWHARETIEKAVASIGYVLVEKTPETKAKKPIEFDYVHPPIPIRMFDWNAAREGYEPGDLIGWGATREDAERELREAEADRGAAKEEPNVMTASAHALSCAYVRTRATKHPKPCDCGASAPGSSRP